MEKEFELTEDWKRLSETVPKNVLDHLYKVVCLQSNCCERGPPYTGNCAWCADTADSIIGEYIRLTTG